MRTVDTYGDIIIFPGQVNNCQEDYHNLSISKNYWNFHFRTSSQFLHKEHQICAIVSIVTQLDESYNQSSILGKSLGDEFYFSSFFSSDLQSRHINYWFLGNKMETTMSMNITNLTISFSGSWSRTKFVSMSWQKGIL